MKLSGVKVFNAIAITALSIAVSGCGYLFGDTGVFRDKSEDYKKAPEMDALTVPEGKDSSALQDIYVVPRVEDSLVLSGEFEVPKPTPLVAGAAGEIVRIQKLGEERWALIAMAPGQLWPQIRAFLATAGFPIGRVDARLGIMESGWVDLENYDIASRFRFRIEQGVQRGNSELHVLQMNQAGDINSWPETSDNLQQESDMLQGIAQYIANSSDSTPVSMIADQAMSASGKISLQETDSGDTFIRVGLNYQRAWASLARALEASTFEITDRDRSQGSYFVRFIGPDADDEGGWFDWLFEEDDHPLANQEFLVTVVSEDESNVAIGLEPFGDTPPLEVRQKQALLALIKGNIN